MRHINHEQQGLQAIKGERDALLLADIFFKNENMNWGA